MSDIVVAHISDLHFGGRADFPQLAVLAKFLPSLGPRAIVVSGDISQRARHGEFQAARLWLEQLARSAPLHIIPGNHDAQWWRSPLGVLGERTKFLKYRSYFGEDLAPTLELDGLVIVGLLSAHGFAFRSMTFNPNDCTVKGHLSQREVERVRGILARTPATSVRMAVLHHNVLPGVISHRWGLARPHQAQKALLTLGADIILCGHDHTEGAGQIDGSLAVSTAGTPSLRTRGGRSSAFNVIRVNDQQISVQSYIYVREQATYRAGDVAIFARARRAV